MSMTTRGTGRDNDRWVLPLGAASGEGLTVQVTDQTEGWTHTSLRVAELAVSGSLTLHLPTTESILVPLNGGAVVVVEREGQPEKRLRLSGRPSVFAGPTDVAYVPAGSVLTVTNDDETPSRIAICGAEVGEYGSSREVVRLPANTVPVELRGAGQASREVRNFGTPEVLDAEKIIACEVVTPAGNWSSYPPHKHDEARPGVETELEEIYYFEVQVAEGVDTSEDADPIGYQRVYGTPDRPIDVVAEVRTGDVVLVPHGWHGPAAAPPGYDLYYLNVMAGPGSQRAWLICDDPAHGWVRDTWPSQEMDPRLPLGSRGEQR